MPITCKRVGACVGVAVGLWSLLLRGAETGAIEEFFLGLHGARTLSWESLWRGLRVPDGIDVV